MTHIIVNHNGDTAERLIEQYSAVREAAQALTNALRQVECHGRNYPAGGRENDLLSKHIQMSNVEGVAIWALENALQIQEQV